MSRTAAAMPVEDGEGEGPVYVVDDEPSARDSLRYFLESLGLKTELFDSPQTFLANYAIGAPGCMILDLRFPKTSGFDLLDHMREHDIDLPVLILSAYATVPLTVRAMQAGAFAVFEKPFDGQLLLESVQRAFAINWERRRERADIQAAVERIDRLSPRERQVAAGIVSGNPNKTTADELGLAEKTVEAHRKRVMDKTRARSVAELVRVWDLSCKRKKTRK